MQQNVQDFRSSVLCRRKELLLAQTSTVFTFKFFDMHKIIHKTKVSYKVTSSCRYRDVMYTVTFELVLYINVKNAVP